MECSKGLEMEFFIDLMKYNSIQKNVTDQVLRNLIDQKEIYTSFFSVDIKV